MSKLRAAIDLTVNIVGQLKRGRKLDAIKDDRDGFVKINIGCGLSVAKGWLNIDGSLNAMFASWPKWMHSVLYRLSGARQYYSVEQYCAILKTNQFLHHDLSLSLPLKNNAVDFIYSSHFFEHLFKDEASNLLVECARALKPGGIIRISVPDLAYAVSLYGLGRKAEMLEDYFFVVNKGSYLSRHKYMYDFDMLKVTLEQAGFSDVRRCEYRQGETPDIEVLDVYPEVSLFVEAARG
jgi:predicted SAM-dependent methyltransferase